MDAGQLALFIPILALIIPIVAIISTTFQKMYETKHERMRSKDKRVVDDLKKRVEELEGRVMTLQDIVIAGDYEARRRIDRAMSAQTNVGTPLPPEADHHHSTVSHPASYKTEG